MVRSACRPTSSESDTGMSLCRVLVVDDSRLFLLSVGNLLLELPGIEVVDLVPSAREALEIANRLRLDLVLTDLAMPDIDGLELTRHLRKTPNAPCVLIMTVDDQPRYRAAAIAAGAAGFVSKSDLVTQLPILIRQLLPCCEADPGDDPS